MKKKLVIAVGCVLVVSCTGCLFSSRGGDSGNAGAGRTTDGESNIPPSLVWRMYQAHNAARDRGLNGGQPFDTEELFGGDIAATHNLAVLEWRHRNFRLGMDPQRIKRWLEEARRLNVPTAESNLKVLLDHIPESDMSEASHAMAMGG